MGVSPSANVPVLELYFPGDEQKKLFNLTMRCAQRAMSMHRVISFLLLANLLTRPPAEAAPGDLDRSFARGEVITCLGETGPVTAMAVMNDGTAVAAGQVQTGGFYVDRPYVLARFQPNGTPDYSAGERGLLFTGSRIWSMSRQRDGKLLLAVATPGLNMTRLNADGTLDSSFAYGELLESTDPDYNHLVDVTVASLDDGRSIVAGLSNSGAALRRVFANGGHDSSFGIAGVARHAIWPKCLFVQPDGKILVGGKIQQQGGGGTDFAVVRLLEHGAMDISFGIAGVSVLDLGSGVEVCLGLLAQSDGGVIATGQSGSGQVVVRLTPQGMLDPAFGTGGRAVSPFLGASLALLPLAEDDGRFLVIGRHDSTDDPPVSNHHVVCYTSSGSVDLAYGANGVAIIGRAQGTGNDALPRSFGDRLANGSIVVGCHVWNSVAPNFRLVKLDPTGMIDSSYGGGIIRLAESGEAWFDRFVGRQFHTLPDGTILFPSRGSSGGSSITEVHAFLSNGMPDEGFGVNGVLSMNGSIDVTLGGATLAALPDGRFVLAGTRIGAPSWAYSGRLASGLANPEFNGGLVSYTSVAATGSNPVMEMAFDAEGRLVSVGRSTVSGSRTDVALARHLPDGKLDTSFGQGGIVHLSIADFDAAYSLNVLPDGRILIGGRSGTSLLNLTPFFACYLADGSLDPAFGIGGLVLGFPNAPAAVVNDVALLPDGRFVAVLMSPVVSQSDKPILYCFQSNGSLDPTFGSGGRALDFPAGVNGRSLAIAVQKDGRIVITGGGRVSTDLITDDVAVWRYEANGVPDTSFGHLGRRIIAASGYTDEGRHLDISPGNKITVATQSTTPADYAVVGAFCGLIRLEGGALMANLTLGSPKNLSESGVTLRGTVNPNGHATHALMEYGLTTSYGQSVPLALIDEDGTVPENVEAPLSGLSAGTTYHYRLTATTAAGTRSTQDGMFWTLLSLPTWRQLHFGSTANSGNGRDTADLDFDGIPNLLEWACGLSPTQPSRLNMTAGVVGGVIEFTYERDMAAGAACQVEWSDDLSGASWNTTDVSETVVGASGKIQTVKATLPSGTNGRRFVRLRVSVLP
jgi:uncharacterized delta-60 repeat protein